VLPEDHHVTGGAGAAKGWESETDEEGSDDHDGRPLSPLPAVLPPPPSGYTVPQMLLWLHTVGIDRRLFCRSTVGSFADQPSETNTWEKHEAMELESWFVLRTT
jgi:hypothetical protein